MSERKITRKELAENNGKNGKPLYVAVDGKVYEISGSDLWADGDHMGHLAGQDLSEEILAAPHDKSKLDKFKMVGTLV